MAAVPSPAPQLTCDDLLRLKPSLQAHLESFRPLFPRRDQGASFLAYAEGLLSGERRKSVERMVLRELNGDMNQVRRLQYFAADSPWSDQPFPERHWQAVGAELGTREGVLLVDTTDMPKQGVHSVGVARQYCGRLGKIENCQAGVFVAYAGAGGATLVHRRLFLTEAWTGDAAYAERRRRCGVPAEATFRTKPQLALELLGRAGGRRFAAGALGGLRRGLRPLGRLPGRGGRAGAGLRGGGGGRHAGLAGTAADRDAPHAGAAGARSPGLPRGADPGGAAARGGLDAPPDPGGQPRARACRLRHPTGGRLPQRPAGPRRLARAAPPVRGRPGPGVPLPGAPPGDAGPPGPPDRRAPGH